MSGFTKLFSSIVDSTIWREDDKTRIVWITMLAKSDKFGQVMVSIPGLADAARVSLDECVAAIGKLSSPDEWSRSKEFEGRRIEAIDGGFCLLNYGKYRELRSEEERREQVRGAVARHRARKAGVISDVIKPAEVSHGKPIAEAEAKAEAEAEHRTPNRPSIAERPPRRPYQVGAATVQFLSVYDSYPNKSGKIAAAQVFQELAADTPGGEMGLSNAITARFSSGMLKRPPYNGAVRYVPSLERFLAERRWEDAEQPKDDPEPKAEFSPRLYGKNGQ